MIRHTGSLAAWQKDFQALQVVGRLNCEVKESMLVRKCNTHVRSCHSASAKVSSF